MANDQPEIPSTLGRLSTSITLRLLPQDIDPKNISAALVQQAKILGAVTEFSEVNDRPAEPRYELDSDLPGEIIEQIPQLVTRTLTINRAVLYENDMLEAFGISGGDLINQSRPFAILKVESAPPGAVDSKGASIPSRITIFTGCWFTANPKTFSVSGRELRIIQNATVSYARRRVVLA